MVSVSADLRRVGALARRDLLAERTYHWRHGLRLFSFVMTVVIAHNVSKLVVDRPELTRYGGSYFDFVLVGLAIMSVTTLGIGAFNANIMREQSLGTLEALLVTPTPISVLLAGSFMFPLMLTALDLVLYLGIGVGVIGGGLDLAGLPLAIALLAATLGTFCAFGIMGASVVLLSKRGDPFSRPLGQITGILSGALFPVSTFPWPLELLARAFPAYYGINGLRETLLGGAGWADAGPDLLVLLGFCAVLLPLSLAVFARSLTLARRTGTLGSY